MKLILLWIFIASVVAFALFGIDKAKAKRKQWRIPEKVLLTAAALGGGLGALLGMQIFRHKTKHWKFLLGVPACILLNAAVAYLLYTYLLS